MPTITQLNLYPIKSCGGIALREATLTASGLMSEHIYDREWMVVDEQGRFLTQRDLPKMTLIKPRIKSDTLEIRAPGMLALEIPLDLPHPDDAQTREVLIWNDKIQAYDCGDLTATWFSQFLGLTCRLVRFHPEAQRHADSRWAGNAQAPVLFSDGYPTLIVSEGSLADLNEKLTAQKRDALSMSRFRPNIVIEGIGAFEEDYADAIRMGKITLKPVKPCSRCSIPSIDPATGEIGPDPLDILQTYRTAPLLDGAIAFGMNAVLSEGEQQVVRVGQEIDVSLAF